MNISTYRFDTNSKLGEYHITIFVKSDREPLVGIRSKTECKSSIC